MGSFGLVRMKAIRTMLDECAPGHSFEEKKHPIWITWQGRTFLGLPIGERGKDDPEIQVGKVRKMIRFLGIEMDCAKRHLPILDT